MGKDQELLTASRLGDFSKVERLVRSQNHNSSSSWNLAHTFRIKTAANVNFQDASGYTPLHYAALNDHQSIVVLLLRNAASTLTVDKQGNSPLHLAAWKGNNEIVISLLTHGPSIAKINQKNKENETALHFACQYGNNEIVKTLLNYGAECDARNSRIESPLDLASQYGRVSSVELLIRHQPSLLLQTCSTNNNNNIKFTPLHLASRNGHLEVVKILLENGANINDIGDNGTALHEAALFCKFNVVKLLLQKGVNPNANDPQNRTALMLVQQLDSSIAKKIARHILIRLQEGCYDALNYDLSSFRDSWVSTELEPVSPTLSSHDSYASSFRKSTHRDFLRRSNSQVPDMNGRKSPPLPRVVEEKNSSVDNRLMNSRNKLSSKQSIRGLIRTNWRSSLSRPNLLRRSNSQQSSKSLPRLPSSTPRSREASPRTNASTGDRIEEVVKEDKVSAPKNRNHPSSQMFPVQPVISNKEGFLKSNENSSSKYDDNVFIQTKNDKSKRRTRSFDPTSVENELKSVHDSSTPFKSSIEPLKDSSSTNCQKVPNKPARKKLSTSSVLSTSLHSPSDNTLTNASSNNENSFNLTNQVVSPPKQKKAPPLPPKPKHMVLFNAPTPPKRSSISSPTQDKLVSFTNPVGNFRNKTVDNDSITTSNQAQADSLATHSGEDASKPPSPNTAMMLVSHAIQKAISIDDLDASKENYRRKISFISKLENKGNQFSSVPSLIDNKPLKVLKLPPLTPDRPLSLCFTQSTSPKSFENSSNSKILKRQKSIRAQKSSSSSESPVSAKDYVEKRIKSLRRKSISEAKSPLHNENHIFEQLKNLKPTKKNTPMQFPKEINLRTDASKKHVEEPNNGSNEVEVFRQTKKQSLQSEKPRINGSNDNLKYSEHTNDNLRKEDFSRNVINEVIDNLKEHKKISTSTQSSGSKNQSTQSSALSSLKKKVGKYLSSVHSSPIFARASDRILYDDPVGSSRSLNTWDDNLSERTEDNLLPPCLKKFRGLIRGAANSCNKNIYTSKPSTTESTPSGMTIGCVEKNMQDEHSNFSKDKAVHNNPKTEETISWGRVSVPSSPTSSEITSSSEVVASQRHHSHYDNQSPVTKILPNVDVIKDTVTSVRKASKENPITINASKSVHSNNDLNDISKIEDVNISSLNIDEEWKKIASIMTSVTHDVTNANNSHGSQNAFNKEFEQTFWKIMTGKHESSIQGWLHDIQLEIYYNVLVGNGFDDVNFIADGILESCDLLHMGINEPKHVNSIMTSLEKLAPISIAHPDDLVVDWLQSLQLESYEGELVQMDCFTVDHVTKLNDSNLKSIFKKLGHYKRVKVSLNTLTVSSSTIEKSKPYKRKPSASRRKSLDQRRIGGVKRKSVEDQEIEISSGESDFKQLQMASEPTSDLPDLQRAQYLASEVSSGSLLSLRPPNETTEQVTVSAWRHKPEVLISDCKTYQAQYLGSKLIVELKGAESTLEACSKMKRSTQDLRKMPLITLKISYKGVKFIDFISKHEIAEHDISNISFASQHEEDLQTFAYITHDVTTGKHYCHVFRVSTLDTAYEIILTLGQAFETAYQLILKDQATTS